MRIINGVYHYDILVDDGVRHIFTSHLFRVTERKRKKLEDRILSKVERSLDSIYYETKRLRFPEQETE